MPSLMKMLNIGVRRSYFCLCFHNEENEVRRVASCPRPEVLLVHIIDSMTPLCRQPPLYSLGRRLHNQSRTVWKE